MARKKVEKVSMLSARIPEQLHRQLRVFAARTGITISAIATTAIEAELQRRRAKVAADLGPVKV